MGATDDAAGRSYSSLPPCYDATARPPTLPEQPKQVVVLMRHGDRSPISGRVGTLDASGLAPAFQRLMPPADVMAELARVPIERAEEKWSSHYSKFVGEPPWGQLTARGVEQCRAVGKEFRRRYPKAIIQAFSTGFPRTLQSAAAFLCGFAPSEEVVVRVRPAKLENLLPNFDGACKRYAHLRAELGAKAKEGNLKALRQDLHSSLEALIGPNPWQYSLDFRGFLVHADTVGDIGGLDWHLLERVEEYTAKMDAACYEDAEVVRLASGRLLHWLLALVAQPKHEMTLLLAHDNMLSAFLVALGIYREGEWPMYASSVVMEAADFAGDVRKVRVLVNDEVRRDWQALSDFDAALRGLAVSQEDYERSCAEGDESPRKRPRSS
eukprot:TRINITY_DN101510_c0_g1_i1.p1 TRINITY_DN101510_c0_g1~~TRINITY_DN101510_c0_g1_i1.p1  ORF type:complete len:381 (+),score=76.74 TRINITY_DN101510_c0_g1_i1:68-1210(+)